MKKMTQEQILGTSACIISAAALVICVLAYPVLTELWYNMLNSKVWSALALASFMVLLIIFTEER